MYKTTFEDYAHGEFDSDENSDGHIGDFEEATNEASKWPEELCGAQQALHRNRYDAKRPEMVRTGNEFVGFFFSLRSPRRVLRASSKQPSLDTFCVDPLDGVQLGV